MTRLTRSTAVALVFLVGCATGGAASHIVVPKANAQNSQKWDHLCLFEDGDNEDVTAMAKKAGSEGWELVGAGSYSGKVWCFKRPL